MAPMSIVSPSVHSWLILLFAAINMIFLGGKRRAFGTFVAELRKEDENITLSELNWIGDSYSALGYMSTGVSIAIVLHFNRRYRLFQVIGAVFVLVSCISSSFVPNAHWLFFTHTIFHGIGSSLVISVVGLVVNEHFNKKHPYHILATTLVSGGSVAAILFIELFAYLIVKYDWRRAFVILGVVYFLVLCSAALVFCKKEQVSEVTESKRMKCNLSEIKGFQVPLLVMWFLDRVLTSVVTYGLLLNLTDYVHRIQPSLLRSTILTTLFAGGEGSTYLIGAIITAATKDFFKNKLKYILFITSLAMGASLVGLEFSTHSLIARRMLCFVAGFSLGPSITFLFPAGEELTQLPGHIAYPFSLGGMGFGMIISPLLTAKIAERFKYKWFFLVQGSLIFVKAFCLLIIIILIWCYKRSNLMEDVPEDTVGNTKLEVDFEDVNDNTLLINAEQRYSK